MYVAIVAIQRSFFCVDGFFVIVIVNVVGSRTITAIETDDVMGTKAEEERIEPWPREQRRRGNLRIRTGGARSVPTRVLSTASKIQLLINGKR